MFRKIFAGCLILQSFLIYSQTTTNRIELDLNGDFTNFNVLPLTSEGLLLQSNADQAKKGQLEVKYDFYDSELQLKGTQSVFVKERTQSVDTYQKDHTNYTLIRNKRDYIAVISTDFNTQQVTKVESAYSDEAELSGMKVFNNKAVFKAIERKTNSIIIIDLKSGALEEVAFNFGNYRRGDVEIEDFQVFDDEILVYVNAKNNRKSEDLYVATLDLNGKQKDFYKVTTDINEKLINISATKVADKYILTGTYSKTKSDLSQGLFFAEIQNSKLNFIKFYNFVDLQNFTNYMSDRQQQKIERLNERASNKNKELVLNYNILNHPVKVVDSGYIFLGEAYYPTYVTITSNNGTTTYFDGFFYTHGVIAKFDKEGNLVWDNSFELAPDYKPMKLKKFISLGTNESMVDLSFGNLKELIYKQIDAKSGKVLLHDVNEIIDTKLEGDKIRKSFSDVTFWYKNYFIAYGAQTVTNNSEERRRSIFFVNKIKLNK